MLAPPVSDDDDELAAIVAGTTNTNNTTTSNVETVSASATPELGAVAVTEEEKEAVSTNKNNDSTFSKPKRYHVPNPIPDRVPNPLPTAWSNSSTSGIINPSKRQRQDPVTSITSAKKSRIANYKSENNLTAKTPAAIRTSVNGIPNPLLFGRPVDLPAKDGPQKKAIPKTKSKVEEKTGVATCKTKGKKATQNKAPVANTNKQPYKMVAIRVPKITMPPLTMPPIHQKDPLCKVTFKAKVEPTIANTETAIAKVEAPRQTLVKADSSKGQTSHSHSSESKRPSGTVSEKKEQQRELSVEAKKTSDEAAVTVTKGTVKSVNGNTAVTTANREEPTLKPQKYLVANPLANVPRTYPPKAVVPPVKNKNNNGTKEGGPLAVTKTNSQGPKAALVTGKSTVTQTTVPSSLALEQPPQTTSLQPVVPLKVSSDTSKTEQSALTAAERAKACRDRNRQHARNTRLRKKAYVEELKRSLLKIAEERDELVAKKQKKVHLKETRKQIMQQLLQLFGAQGQQQEQSSNDSCKALVHDPKSFTFTMPNMTPYYHGQAESVKNDTSCGTSNRFSSGTEKTLLGLQDVLAEAKSMALFLDTLGGNLNTGSNAGAEAKSPVHTAFKFDEDNCFVMDGTTGILNWQATSCGAITQVCDFCFMILPIPIVSKQVSHRFLYHTTAFREPSQSYHLTEFSKHDFLVIRINWCLVLSILILGLSEANSYIICKRAFRQNISINCTGFIKIFIKGGDQSTTRRKKLLQNHARVSPPRVISMSIYSSIFIFFIQCIRQLFTTIFRLYSNQLR